MEADNVRVTFGALDFAFREPVGSQADIKLVGFAPKGRTGIVEVTDQPDDTRVSLLLSVDRQPRNRVWSAMCVSSLAEALDVDFAGWLGDHVRRLGYADVWSVTREFGQRSVSAEFFPADTLLITVDAQSTTRQ